VCVVDQSFAEAELRLMNWLFVYLLFWVRACTSWTSNF